MRSPVPERCVEVADVEAAVQLDHVEGIVIGSFDPEAIGEQIASREGSAGTASARTPTTPMRTPWSDRFGSYDGLDVQTEGRLVWTAGTVPTRTFDHLSPGGPGDGVHTAN